MTGVVTVTGATGHIGPNLIRALLDDGRRVRAVVRRSFSGQYGFDEVEYVRADMRDAEQVAAAVAGSEAVYHLAAVISIAGDPTGEVRDTNVIGVENVCNAALKHGVRRLIHCSSIHAFDMDAKDPAITEASARADRPSLPAYDRAKYQGELAVLEAVGKGLDAVIVNPTGVIGPTDYRPSRMGTFFLRAYEGSLPAFVSGGIDWVDVRDVAAGMIAAERKGKTGENYILGSEYKTIRELAALIREHAGRCPGRWVCPMWLARAVAPVFEWGAKQLNTEPLFTSEALHALRANTVVSHDKAARELGYAPRSISDSVRDLMRWFVAAGFLEPLGKLEDARGPDPAEAAQAS